MAIQEIVGVVIDDNQISCDPSEIYVSREFGRRLNYITRERAEALGCDPKFKNMAVGPTLFLIENGILFCPIQTVLVNGDSSNVVPQSAQ